MPYDHFGARLRNIEDGSCRMRNDCVATYTNSETEYRIY